MLAVPPAQSSPSVDRPFATDRSEADGALRRDMSVLAAALTSMAEQISLMAQVQDFQFTDLEITDDISDEELEVQTRGREISRTLDDGRKQESSVGRMNGWTLSWQPEGFVPAAAPRSGSGKAVAFSDGLAAFSVFVEPVGRLKMPTGASRIGATTIYMREVMVSDRPFLIAVVGEIPPGTARKVADAVEVDDDFVAELSGHDHGNR